MSDPHSPLKPVCSVRMGHPVTAQSESLAPGMIHGTGAFNKYLINKLT